MSSVAENGKDAQLLFVLLTKNHCQYFSSTAIASCLCPSKLPCDHHIQKHPWLQKRTKKILRETRSKRTETGKPITIHQDLILLVTSFQSLIRCI